MGRAVVAEVYNGVASAMRYDDAPQLAIAARGFRQNLNAAMKQCVARSNQETRRTFEVLGGVIQARDGKGRLLGAMPWADAADD